MNLMGGVYLLCGICGVVCIHETVTVSCTYWCGTLFVDEYSAPRERHSFRARLNILVYNIIITITRLANRSNKTLFRTFSTCVVVPGNVHRCIVFEMFICHARLYYVGKPHFQKLFAVK